MSGAVGYTLLELLFVTALVITLAGVAVPLVLTSLDRSRGRLAARFLGTRMALARSLAVSRTAAVALRFEETPRGITFALYQDGNRNGVRSADISSNIDRRIEAPLLLADQFAGAEIGLIPGMGSDPVQIGNSNILTFTPAGTATSGTVYVRGRDNSQWAVRVLGATGRTRVLRYEPRTGQWKDAF